MLDRAHVRPDALHDHRRVLRTHCVALDHGTLHLHRIACVSRHLDGDPRGPAGGEPGGLRGTNPRDLNGRQRDRYPGVRRRAESHRRRDVVRIAHDVRLDADLRFVDRERVFRLAVAVRGRGLETMGRRRRRPEHGRSTGQRCLDGPPDGRRPLVAQPRAHPE